MRWEDPVASTGEKPPEPRVYHTANTYRNYLVIYGGRGGYDSELHIRRCFPLLHLYDTVG